MSENVKTAPLKADPFPILLAFAARSSSAPGLIIEQNHCWNNKYFTHSRQTSHDLTAPAYLNLHALNCFAFDVSNWDAGSAPDLGRKGHPRGK